MIWGHLPNMDRLDLPVPKGNNGISVLPCRWQKKKVACLNVLGSLFFVILPRSDQPVETGNAGLTKKQRTIRVTWSFLQIESPISSPYD